MSSMFAKAVLQQLLVAATGISAACGDGASTSVTPASPTSVRASSSTGAVITGRVNSVSTAPSTVMAADRWSAAGISTMAITSIRVTVIGPSVSTQVDGAGQFTLTDVPPGTVQLKFSGAGIDATLSLTGVAANDRIEINVTLNGNRARLDSTGGRREQRRRSAGADQRAESGRPIAAGRRPDRRRPGNRRRSSRRQDIAVHRPEDGRPGQGEGLARRLDGDGDRGQDRGA